VGEVIMDCFAVRASRFAIDEVPFCRRIAGQARNDGVFFNPANLVILKILIQTNIQKKIIVFIQSKKS